MNTIVNLFSKQFYFFASIASIVALIIVFIKDEFAVYIALIYFCCLLLAFTGYLIHSLFKIFEHLPDDYNNVSTFIKYSTTDGNKIIYETYKLITE